MPANELFRERKEDGISFGPVLARFRTEPVIAEGNMATFLPPLQNVRGFSDTTSGSGSGKAKQPQIIILPPPCLTVGLMFLL